MTAVAFATRFPEFASVDAGLLAAKEEEAALVVDDTWIESEQGIARQYLVAHLLSMEGHGTNQGGSAAGPGGQVIEETVGPVTMKWANSSSSSESVTSTNGLQATHYGRRFLEYRRRSIPSVLGI